MTLENRTVAVTGANGNLGRAVVEQALAQGARVVMLDVAFDEEQDTLPGDRTVRKAVNLLDGDATRACFEEIGPLQGLCNAAGGFAMGAAVHESDDQDWTRMYDINVRTLLNAVRSAVPAMLPAGGAIVNIGAAGALSGAALMGPYTAAKSAVMRISESMAGELGDEGINVNCVMPSVIDTPQNREAMPDAEFGEWVSPEQLARVICFLLSDAADGMHGALVPVKNRA